MLIEPKIASSAGMSEAVQDATNRPSVLVLTHSHPRLTKGGAEISADSLVRAMKRDFGMSTWLIGCSRSKQTERVGVPFTQPFGADNYVYQGQDSFAWFNFANRDPKFPNEFREILTNLNPDIVHFHHYAQFGVEAFDIVRSTLPNARIVLTLHEYLAICNHFGQMIKTHSNTLCHESSLIECANCFPHLTPRDFFLRKNYIMTFFERVDWFISPSQFLRDRYVAWGLSEHKISVIENVTPNAPAEAPISAGRKLLSSMASAKATSAQSETKQRVRIGFFGQMSPLKGIIVLLDAAAALEKLGVDNISIEIHGTAANQPPAFQDAIKKALEGGGGNVTYVGPYENHQVFGLMRGVDAVVVPSTWWENAPVVIEEALAVGKPVICSNIGGMAEKVRDGVDGLHFDVGDSRHLAELLTNIADAPEILNTLARTARKPASPNDTVEAHIELYRALLSNNNLGQ